MPQDNQPTSKTLFPTLTQILARIASDFDFTTAETVAQLMHVQLDGLDPTKTYLPYTPDGAARIQAWRIERHGE